MSTKIVPTKPSPADQPVDNVSAGEQNSYRQQALDDMHNQAHGENAARRNAMHRAGKMPAPTNVK